jgi:hypothetical protein
MPGSLRMFQDVILSEAKDLCIFPAPKYMDSSPPLGAAAQNDISLKLLDL